MRLPPFSYLEPTNLEGLLGLLSTYKSKAKMMAGGTDIVPLLKKRLVAPQLVVGLRAVKGFAGVRAKRGVVEIGSCTTLTELAADKLIKAALSGLHEAVRSVAAPAIRNIATLGGNILQGTRCLFYNQSELFRSGLEPCHKRGGSVCHAVRGSRKCFSVYQGDVAPALIALDSRAELASKRSSRIVAVQDLFSGNGKKPLTLKPGEVLTRIHVPLVGTRSGCAYEKLRFRGAIDYPVVSSAVFVSLKEDGAIERARVVLSGCGSGPRFSFESGEILAGTKGEARAIERAAEAAGNNLEMAGNTGVPADYRRRMVPVMVRRAFARALEATREGH